MLRDFLRKGLKLGLSGRQAFQGGSGEGGLEVHKTATQLIQLTEALRKAP